MDLTLALFAAGLQYHGLGVVLHIKNGSIVLDHLDTDPRRALGLSLSQSETFFSVTHCSLTRTAGKCEGGNERTTQLTSQLPSRQLDLREWPRRRHPGPSDMT